MFIVICALRQQFSYA